MPTDRETDRETARDPARASARVSASARGAASLAAAAALAFAVFAAALALRLKGLGSAAVSLDEVYTQFAVSRDWLGMVLDRASRGHMPTYFALAKVTVPDVADITALRRPGAVADALAAAILAGGIARLVSLPAGFWAGTFYATGPAFVIWAQNARPYGLLMACIAIGLIAAMALASRASQPASRADIRAGRAFSLGWAGAVFTLTGGIVAYLAVVLTPRLRGGPLSAAAFRARWRRAALLPSGLAVFGYLAVSRPHVYEGGVGGFWVEDFRPFGADGLAELGFALAGGRLRDLAPILPPTGEAAALTLMLAAFLALAVAGGLRARTLPALWPLLGLALGFTCVMLAASAVSSLLLDRYFLPAWAAILALAALGLARLPALVQALIGLPLAGASLAFALASAEADPGPGASYARLAAAIEASGHREAEILADEIFSDLRRDILTLRLGEPELPRPNMRGASPERLSAALEADAPAFLAVSGAAWDATYRAMAPEDACTLRAAGAVLVWLGAGPCPGALRP